MIDEWYDWLSESARVNRLFFIVLTDFCCWVPVIVLGILSLTGSFTDESGLVYVWVAVFVLPLNSSVNPILYTLSTSYAKEKFRAIWSAGLSIWRPKSGNILQYTCTHKRIPKDEKNPLKFEYRWASYFCWKFSSRLGIFSGNPRRRSNYNYKYNWVLFFQTFTLQQREKCEKYPLRGMLH